MESFTTIQGNFYSGHSAFCRQEDATLDAIGAFLPSDPILIVEVENFKNN